jgi:hypothetical protein
MATAAGDRFESVVRDEILEPLVARLALTYA